MPFKRICPFCEKESISITKFDDKKVDVELSRKDSRASVVSVSQGRIPLCIQCGSDCKGIGERKNARGETAQVMKCLRCELEFDYEGQAYQCSSCFRYWGWTNEAILSILKEHVDDGIQPDYPDPEDTKDVVLTIDWTLQNGLNLTKEELETLGGMETIQERVNEWTARWAKLKREWGINVRNGQIFRSS